MNCLQLNKNIEMYYDNITLKSQEIVLVCIMFPV